MAVSELEKAVFEFRSILDQNHGQFGPVFQRFPIGSCGAASELLAAYLKDKGFGIFSYHAGWSSSLDTSHAWLQNGETIVDVTADQFEEGKPLVTTDQSWYDQFSERNEVIKDGDFRLMAGDPTFLSSYGVILRLSEST